MNDLSLSAVIGSLGLLSLLLGIYMHYRNLKNQDNAFVERLTRIQVTVEQIAASMVEYRARTKTLEDEVGRSRSWRDTHTSDMEELSKFRETQLMANVKQEQNLEKLTELLHLLEKRVEAQEKRIAELERLGK